MAPAYLAAQNRFVCGGAAHADTHHTFWSSAAALDKWANSIGCVAHIGQSDSEPFEVRDNTESIVAQAWIRPVGTRPR